MPALLEALAASGTPVSILTKGTLLRRDLPLLDRLSHEVPIDLAMSIAVFDDELQHAVEPGTPTTAARLATVAAAREAGLPCGVFMMPVLPYLTDTVAHLDRALAAIKAADASFVLWSALHLKPGVKEWYLDWLARTHPQHLRTYRGMYADGAYAPKAYRQWLSARIRPLIARHGLVVGRADEGTGAVRSRAAGVVQPPPRPPSAVQPALF